MTSKTPLPGDLEKLVEFMKTDEKLKFLTQSYRLTGKKTYKADAPLFAPACYLEGGKGQDNIRELTHLSLVDFDELFTEMPPDITALNALKQKLCDDPHTLLCYITMSGNGIRVIYPYEGDDYPAAFAKGNDYYQQLIGKKADFQCKNVNRLSGLAYDPDAYYKSCAKPFSAEEISKFHTEATKKNQQLKKQDRINTYYEQFIQPKLAADKIIYEPGKHNNYVMRVGYMLAKKRYAHADVLKWALQKFPEYNDVEQVIKSCYDNTPGASRKASGGGGGGGNGGSDNRFASVEEIRNFLDGHIRLRYNLITQRYEFLEIPEGASLASDKPPRWQILLDRHVNSLWTKMSLTVKVGYAQCHRERLYARIQSLRGLLRPSPALEGGRQGLHRRTRCHREGEGYRQLCAELRGMPEKVARGNDCRLAGPRGGQQCHPGLYRKTGCQQDHLVQSSPSAGAEAVLLHKDQCQANDEG